MTTVKIKEEDKAKKTSTKKAATKKTTTKKATATKSTTAKKTTTSKSATKKTSTPKKAVKTDNIEKQDLLFDQEIIDSMDEYDEYEEKNQFVDDIEEKRLFDKRLILSVLIGLAIIIIIIIIILMVTRQNDDRSAIDKSLSTYQGKEIYQDKDGNTVIVEENDSKTIESKKSKPDYIEADKDVANKYSITNVNISKVGTNTIIKGKVKNDASSYNKVYVNVKFYADDKVIGSSSTLVTNLKKNKTDDFEIKILGDFTQYPYDIKVEYVG